MKFTIKTTRTIPEGYVRYTPCLGDYPKEMFACYVYRGSDRSSALFYTGKQSKPTWHYKFKDDDAMKQKINTQIKSLMSYYEKKMAWKEERKAKALSVQVGDLFVNSWGYDQTNVDFYQCISKTKSTFTIQKIHGASIKDTEGFMSDRVSPVRDAFIEQGKSSCPTVFKKTSLSMPFGSLTACKDGERFYHSWYA